jgi:hypothetical protein
MRHKIEGNKDGWVEISVLATFTKLQQLTNGGDVEAIKEGAELSSHLRLRPDGLAIARVRPLRYGYACVGVCVCVYVRVYIHIHIHFELVL